MTGSAIRRGGRRLRGGVAVIAQLCGRGPRAGLCRFPRLRVSIARGAVARCLRQHPFTRAAIPRDAAHVGRLTTKTEDRTDELVAIHARTIDKDGRRWLKVSLPILPNGTTGWVPGSALGQITKVQTWLTVDRARLRLTLVRSGRVILRAPIAIGRSIWPTPTGHFYIRNRLRDIAGAMYGPMAFGTSAHSSCDSTGPPAA